MYVLYRRTTTSPGEKKEKEKEKEKEKGRKAAFRVVFFWKWRLGLGGKDEGTVDKIVSHTFFWGGGRDLFLTYQPKEKPFVQSFVRSVYSQIL